ncbi:ABC transporter permease [Paenibacillus sp. J5C_2022]|uniref:ABC transporter permease n=1 Tax=Paenibacillus sp. J5C2022 TaxID=2977129 RepID=UPI0021D00899|nr:ABC transporter permease [Paenibacillus sp. J5C2022]MCU6708733.1 ABC transporter permease [Paenibacillus sp. J5C2022]
MYLRIIRNDIARSKLVSLTTMAFIAAAAMLVSLAAILVVNLSGAIDTLMTRAATPHVMQMHAGELDHARLSAFAERNEHVEEFQVLEFLNMDGSHIQFGDRSLASSVQDNGFSTQSGKFDYLLDLEGQVIQAAEGELYVPISYREDGIAAVGDKAVISGKELTVAGFLRDSQMNSSLASSKRFLIHREDFEELRSAGTIEYLIEFRLKDYSKLSEFQQAYAAAELEANGPTLTYSLFKTINALSDGMMIGVILLISVLVVAIALLSIRFTLLAKIEDDYREIGVMKAIGLRIADMKKIYYVKYAAIATVGSILGLALSIAFKDILLENIRLNMGESDNASVALLFGIIGIVLVFLAIMAYVSGVLRRFRKISPAEAIRAGASQEKKTGAKRYTLSRSRLFNTNVFLGIKDVLARKKLYATMLAVLIISAFIMIVPQNLHNTITSSEFIKYMGIGNSDMRIDIQQTDSMEEKAAEIMQTMSGDKAISQFVVLTTKTFRAKKEDGTEERLKVELGDHSVFPVAYSEGRAPATEDEIALSSMNADELGKGVGGTITLVMDGKEKQLTVSGIYSDITNGGKTAKALFTDYSANTMWYVISATLSDPSIVESKVSEYAGKFNYAKVSDIREYMAQTYGSTINSVGKSSYTAIIVAIAITALVTLLFMRMLVAKDRHAIAVLKVLGFTRSDVRVQYISRAVFVLIAGIACGTLLANTLGEMLAGAVISSFGASTFQFTADPLSAYVLSPLLLLVALLIATIIGTSSAGRMTMSEHMRE